MVVKKRNPLGNRNLTVAGYGCQRRADTPVRLRAAKSTLGRDIGLSKLTHTIQRSL